jgi:starch synthase (maltosyl-transferring)
MDCRVVRTARKWKHSEGMKIVDGRKRVIIEEVRPQVDCGRYAVKRIIGDAVKVTAAIFCDGHELISGRMLYRHSGERAWRFQPLVRLDNDLWSATFVVDKLGDWSYTLEAWVDHFASWRADILKRVAAQSSLDVLDESAFRDATLAFLSGARLLHEAAQRAEGSDRELLEAASVDLANRSALEPCLYECPLSDEVETIAKLYPDLDLATQYERELHLWVDRERARYSTWYELFPRSTSPYIGEHGTFTTLQMLLPSIAEMGFDVLYLPPIHPIGTSFRKGKNNSVTPTEVDPGSPWAIGSKAGGHKSIHPQLGTLQDFRALVAASRHFGLEIALDIAFQCSPDHPWVREHPDWFVIRPDGSIQYAENPPKKYQDIYPLNFESSDWQSLWKALRDVFTYWVEQDIRIFRVDNPHTKALRFWEWCIAEIHNDYPDVIFLSEAFTRPHVMYSLAKAGFTQSYTYFTWRTDAAELRQYFEEISKAPIADFFRSNLWPNTPDILHAVLQTGGRQAFLQRLILAATLGANYGIYGPAFELCENIPAKAGSEEYLNSEKYEIRDWDRSANLGLTPVIAQINNIRRKNPALQSDCSLHFHPVDNPNILCYSKTSGDNRILVVISLDTKYEQAGWTELDLQKLGIRQNENLEIEDLLTGIHYQWLGTRNYVALRPDAMPAHVFRLLGRSDHQAIQTQAS